MKTDKEAVPRTASDNLCKFLAENYPNQLLHWLFQMPPGPVRVVKTELQREPIRADAALVLERDPELFHVEFQTTSQSHLPLPLRMLDYYVGFKRAFPARDIRQVVVVLKDMGEDVPDHYDDGRAFLRYDVVRMWEQDPQDLLAHDGLTALAVLCRAPAGGAKLLQTVAGRIAQIPDKAVQREQLDMSRVLAGLCYPQRLVYDILLRGNMLEESVVYQDILQEGKKMGLQEGLQHERQIIIRQLTARFGRISGRLKQRVEGLSRRQGEQLAVALLKLNNKAELDAWLAARGH